MLGKRKEQLSIIFTFFIMTMPIINNYASPIPSIGLSEFLIIVISPIMLFVLRKDKFVFHEYWLFFFYGVFISTIIVLCNPLFSVTDISFRLLRDFFYTFVIFLFALKLFHIQYALKLYKKLMTLVCILIWLQYISFYIFDYTLPWVLKGVTLNYSFADTTLYMQHYNKMYNILFRPTSIFLEPAQFAQFVAPFLAIVLFRKNEKCKTDYLLAIFVSISLLLSTSANAYIYVAINWGIWLIYFTFRQMKINNIIVIIMTIPLFIIVFYFSYNYSTSFNQVVNRFINLGDGAAGSGNIRLFRGIYFYSAIDPIFKLFGIGFGSFDSFMKIYPVSTIYEIGIEYMNTLSYILVSTGMIGLILFLFPMYKIYNRGQLCSKILIILLLVTSLSSSIYSTPMYIIMLTFALYLPTKVDTILVYPSYYSIDIDTKNKKEIKQCDKI